MKKSRSPEDVLPEILDFIEKYIYNPSAEEIIPIAKIKERFLNATTFGFSEENLSDLLVGENLLKRLKRPSVRREVYGLYENILMVLGMIRDIKNLGLEKAASTGLISDTCHLIMEYQPVILVQMIRGSLDFRTDVAKGFLAYARDRTEEGLKVLEMLQNYPNLIEELGLKESKFLKTINSERRSLAYLNYSRAGEVKLLKVYCAYPILTILRLQGEKPSKSLKFIHNLLLFAEVPGYGTSPYKSMNTEPEELKRIGEWDSEAVKWYKFL